MVVLVPHCDTRHSLGLQVCFHLWRGRSTVIGYGTRASEPGATLGRIQTSD